jgi:hypothetical protein
MLDVTADLTAVVLDAPLRATKCVSHRHRHIPVRVTLDRNLLPGDQDFNPSLKWSLGVRIVVGALNDDVAAHDAREESF